MDKGEGIQEKGAISKGTMQEDNKYEDEGAGQHGKYEDEGTGRQGRNKANGQANELDPDEYKDRKITKATEEPGSRRHHSGQLMMSTRGWQSAHAHDERKQTNSGKFRQK